ncbi:hypothetical protein MNEG_6909 [Monoraphidium neglectum]|uniref:Glycoside-hydrolase family GH114 TIM-barrel domain-containing protein n=1 Tax=Monoraphidium neglectum TaxID=145388 RepID=A0A0D2L109_9CHLO|nr:hypothetical protein MNEG_6909 [Monoraphidium neglectum]KIZ01054.1 hypothetical protein MNEG_6909 [Monoraphidium neglectum]|eukprot:XP_013900073.1 hypothetical protein MNEG_6909 [Monoraphidium neglectum]
MAIFAVSQVAYAVPLADPARPYLNPEPPATPQARAWQAPPQGAAFQYQLSEQFSAASNTVAGVSVYFVDLFDTPEAESCQWPPPFSSTAVYASGCADACLAQQQAIIWRDDVAAFPPLALGKGMEGWSGERWVDVRSPDIRAVARTRMELCKKKGFLAVDPDNVDLSSTDTGFNLSPADQLAFIQYLADTAHSLGLAFSLKNTPGQLQQLVGSIDMAVNEECAEYDECEAYTVVRDAGKPVYNIEYSEPSFDKLCGRAPTLGITSIFKDRALGFQPRTPCPGQT